MCMEWSKKRRMLYALVFASVAIFIVVYPVYLLINKAPTCSDQKQNGAETGVDCGGGCALQCLAETKAPRIVWAKAFYLGGPYYDLGAFVENPNAKAGVKSAGYTFRVVNSDGKVLAEKKGSTEIAPGTGFVLFEPNIAISGNPDRVEVVFEQEDLLHWIKARIASSVIVTKNKSLKNTDTKPRFDATLVNTDLVNNVANLTASAIIYDARRNPIAVSRTYIDGIPKGGEEGVVFTWPRRFTDDSGEGSFITEIIVATHAVFAL